MLAPGYREGVKLILLLLASASLAMAQKPSDDDAAAIIETSRAKALAYQRSLPDFVCTEIVVRDMQPNGIQRPRPIPSETLTVKLSYFQHKEDHKLLLVDGKPTDRTFESLPGAIGSGEFATTLSAIFEPSSETSFRWESWKTVRGHRAAVYGYTVRVGYSRYLVETNILGRLHKAIVGYHGVLEVDRETGEILHFSYQADNIPQELNLQYVSTMVDYDFADVGGRNYLLPSHSQTIMRSPQFIVRNEMEFREYRKFSADSVIDFGAGK
jgi:hypothetical protein